MDGLDCPVLLLSASGSRAARLSELLAGRISVIDFWHTRCVRCPMTLEMMNDEAVAHPEVQFIACAFSIGEGNDKIVAEKINNWPNLTHVWMDEETKELVKNKFSILSLPYALAIDKGGKVVAQGDPKVVDMLDALKQTEQTSIIAFDEDF